MRVLTFTTVFPNPGRPTHGLFVRERARHLARHCEVRVVAPVPWFPPGPRGAVPRAGAQGGLRVEYPTFVYIPRFLKWLDGLFLFLSCVRRVSQVRSDFDFDLIDAHFAFPEGFAAVLLGRWFRRPVAITMRGTEIPIAAHRWRRRALRWALCRADRVIAVAHPLAAFAIELGVPADRVEVVENGVDAARFLPMDRTEARRRVGLPASGKLLVSVGHLSPRKGFQRVLRVLPEVLGEFPGLTFAVVGGAGAEGDYGPELGRLAGRLRLGDRVVFAGARPSEEVALWLGAADVFVLASDYEGCPNVVLEAMACGQPVVAADVGEVGRLVPPHAGILFGRADDAEALRGALLAALRRPWDRARIRAHAEAHTWEGVARRVLEQWRLAAGGAPSGAREAAVGHVPVIERGPWPSKSAGPGA